MEAHEYKSIVQSNIWDDIKKHHGDLYSYQAKLLCTLDINTDEWIDWTLNNFESAIQDHLRQKPHYDETNKWLTEATRTLGRNEGNTQELNWGKLGSANEDFVKMLGRDNISKMQISQEDVLVRVICNFPGHGVPWHTDEGGSYLSLNPHINIEECVRLWFPLTDWHPGLAFQLGDTLIHHWNRGDVYEIPWGVPHASINFGCNIKYSVSLTGRRV